MAKNLMKRGNVFYARVAVPKTLRELRAAAGHEKNPAEILRSLGTSDKRAADRLLPACVASILKGFVDEESGLRAGGVRLPTPPRAEDFAQARADFLRNELERDAMERIQRPSAAEVEGMRDRLAYQITKVPPADELELLAVPGYLEYQVAKDAAELSSERREVLAAELRKHLAASNYVLVSDVVESIKRERNLDLPTDSLAYKTLASGLMREWLKALETASDRDQGIYDQREELVDGCLAASSSSTLVTDLTAERSVRRRERKGIRTYFDAYMKERKAHVSPSGRQDLWATLRQFIECNGEFPVADYGKTHMAAYKRGLRVFPANAAKLYPGLTFKQVIERSQKDGHPPLKSNTVRSKLAAMSAFGKWLADNVDGVDASNFSTSLPKRDDRERMEPFSLEEVRTILNSYAFTGCESPRNYGRPGNFRLRDWHFWLVLIAAFTGARLNEIVQLRLVDLRAEDGIWVFDITDEGAGLSVKTSESRRPMPVHPQLLDLGLLDYREQLVKRGAKALFDGVQVGSDGRRSKAAGKWFRKFPTSIGVKGKADLGGAHRWRHTLADALRRADVDEYDLAAALGHKIDLSRMSRHYGREMDMSLKKRLEIISRASYPGVDFGLLQSSTTAPVVPGDTDPKSQPAKVSEC